MASRPKRLDALLAIAGALAPGAERAAEVAQAWDKPDDYAEAHADELARRGFDGPAEQLPWLALIELLASAGALAELADKADAEALRRAVEPLAGCPPGAFAWMKHDAELAERSIAELVELAGQALLAKGHQLVRLEGEGLRLALVIVPEGRASALVKAVRATGFGEAVTATGARLGKATQDRVVQARRSAKQPARARRTATSGAGANAAKDATAARAARARYFGRGKETWTVTPAGDGDADGDGASYLTCYEKPRVKYYVHHYFDDQAAARAGLKRQLAEWAAAGFRELSHAEFLALPHADAAYINWTGPFPEDASYVVEGKEVVRCLELRGDAVVESAGTIGYNFGELQNVYHCKTVAAATKRHAQHLAADAHFPAISRAEVVRRYR